ncbi:MAG: DUF1801 domain-containing protein [Gemmatimonadaceae bacterium]
MKAVRIPATIDEYIAAVPPDVKARLQKLRATIRRAAPQATERISYRIPTFHLNGNLVHFAAFAHHIGFYPGAAGIAAFAEQLAAYKHAKGSVQFPHGQALPLKLIAEIVCFRAGQNVRLTPKVRAGRSASSR